MMALGPGDAGCVECLPQHPIQTLPHRNLMREGPVLVPKPLHINRDDRPVHCVR
jgi:hypothetical protein